MIIDGSTQLVVLQFSFSNNNMVPPWIPEEESETFSEHKRRKNFSVKGEKIINEIQDIDVSNVFNDLVCLNFIIINAFCKKREDVKSKLFPHGGRRKYWMVRYTLARSFEAKNISNEFKNILNNEIKESLLKILSDPWRVRAFKNPWFENGEIIENKHQVSINMEVRNPNVSPKYKLCIESGGEIVLI